MKTSHDTKMFCWRGWRKIFYWTVNQFITYKRKAKGTNILKTEENKRHLKTLTQIELTRNEIQHNSLSVNIINKIANLSF